mgnify:CR=1 FL=1
MIFSNQSEKIIVFIVEILKNETLKQVQSDVG